MAEVSAFHSLQEQGREQEPEPEPEPEPEQDQEQEQGSIDDLYAFDFDPLAPPNISFFMPSSHSHNFGSYSDSNSESGHSADPDLSYGGEDQMNFVTDLFASRESGFVVDEDEQDSGSDPFLGAVESDINFRVFDDGDGYSSSYAEELELGFGHGIQLDTVGVAPELGDTSATYGANSTMDGLRVVGMESDSDSEDMAEDINSGIPDDGAAPFGDSDIPLFWDCLGFEEQRARGEELEWEEVDDGVDERDGLSSVIDRIEELSVSSEVSSNQEASDIEEEDASNLEWEVLLAVNNLERAPDPENDGDGDSVSYLDIRDDYIYGAEYYTLFGQLAHNESALKGSPPAAKSVVDNLPMVELTKEELRENNLVCAVCKDEILAEEKVTKLPCCHHYHGDCIIPWLRIRNTCPVCRYELPTDDLDYEQRNTQLGGLGEADLQILQFIYRVVEGRQLGHAYSAPP